MNLDKFISETRLLKKFADELEELYGTMLVIGLHGLSDYDKAFIEDMAKILNTSAGPLAGKEAEFRQYYKHRFEKYRTVIFQGHIADVAIDYGGGVGKAIQCKSSLDDGCAAITNMISDAANQLTGERGETPRPGDRWVIDMIIRSPSNPWPFSAKASYGTKTLAEYKTAACAAIKTAITAYTQSSRGLSPAKQQLLPDTSVLKLSKVAQKNTRLQGTLASNPHAGPVALQTLTVKMRYDFPYPLTHQPPGSTHIKMAAFEVLRNGGQLNVVENRIELV